MLESTYNRCIKPGTGKARGADEALRSSEFILEVLLSFGSAVGESGRVVEALINGR